MRVMLRLPNSFTAVLKDHHGRIARGKVTVEITPQKRHGIYFIHSQFSKPAVMVPVINHDISLAYGRQHWWKVVGVQPYLRLRSYFAVGDIFAKRTGVRPLTSIHTIRRIYKILAQNWIPD